MSKVEAPGNTASAMLLAESPRRNQAIGTTSYHTPDLVGDKSEIVGACIGTVSHVVGADREELCVRSVAVGAGHPVEIRGEVHRRGYLREGDPRRGIGARQ